MAYRCENNTVKYCKLYSLIDCGKKICCHCCDEEDCNDRCYEESCSYRTDREPK